MKSNQLHTLIDTGRTGHWINNFKEYGSWHNSNKYITYFSYMLCLLYFHLIKTVAIN